MGTRLRCHGPTARKKNGGALRPAALFLVIKPAAGQCLAVVSDFEGPFLLMAAANSIQKIR